MVATETRVGVAAKKSPQGVIPLRQGDELGEVAELLARSRPVRSANGNDHSARHVKTLQLTF